MKILVIGSGPIVIGQAAEFDYAGTQACRALKEEGHEVILVNSNPATIMTDPGVADGLYIEPLTPAFLERVIARERPDALLPSLGGQTGLNLATELSDAGVLEKYAVRVLGTPLSAIKMAEDRESFRSLMREIQEPVPESWIVQSEADLDAILDEVPYPCIVRPAYTLGGTGGGVARTREELVEIGRRGLRLSMKTQIMVERSLLGWKEVEYEVMRDANGTCIAICNMENFDPMGVHTGDSIVVAPSQTLSDLEYHMLRTASLKIIQALGIEGGCNVQLAVNPESFDYYIIEVNPRVSRSSALASKATGYPIARVSAKIAVGKRLDEIPNAVTGTTMAAFEPALDYVVVKIPRFPFDKFPTGDRTLFTQMKATGEVMAIDRTFESAFLKAIRGLEVRQKDLRHERYAHEKGGLGVPPKSVSGVPPEEESGGIKKRQGAFPPHWTKEGATYAVTFRLADSVPAHKVQEWKRTREAIDRGIIPDTARDAVEARAVLRERVDRYLDSGEGECPLARPEIGRLVADALGHFDGERYRLHAYAVMPNHVHVVIEPASGEDLAKIVHSWKSFTAKRINAELGREGEVWQSEYFDHLVRDGRDLGNQVRYVLDNPRTARLTSGFVVFGGLQGQDAPDTLGRDARATEELRAAVAQPTDDRLWAIAEALRRGWSVAEVNKLCRVDPWFLRKMQNILAIEARLVRAAETLGESEPLGALVHEAFLIGLPSPTILDLLDVPATMRRPVPPELQELRRKLPDLGEELPVFGKARDTYLGEVHAHVDAVAGEPSVDTIAGREAMNDAFRLFDAMVEESAAKHDLDASRFLFAIQAKVAIEKQKVQPVFKMVDTCAGEFESRTPYFYGTFESEDDGETLALKGHS